MRWLSSSAAPQNATRAVDGLGVGLLLGFLADRALGDPRRGHPVAGFGRAALALQKPLYADRRSNGVLYELALVGLTIAGGVLAGRAVGGRRTGRTTRPVPYAVAVAAATWVVLGGRSLEREAAAVHELAAAGDLPAARRRVRSLVGRDASRLDADELARACVESLAENTSDAVVAPLFWGAVAGIPGLVGYRAINTLDAMVGHRTARWERFGWAAARVDDVANLVPARLGTALTALLSGRPRAVLRIVRRDAPAHPSPNAGPIESAFAATLGVRLGGSNVYGGVAEDRGTLGDGRGVRLDDVPRAIRLSGRLSWATVATVLVLRSVRTVAQRARWLGARATSALRSPRR